MAEAKDWQRIKLVKTQTAGMSKSLFDTEYLISKFHHNSIFLELVWNLT